MTELTHACPAPGCRRRVHANMLACRTHWFSLSPDTRRAVWAAYRQEPGGPEHTAAVCAAIEELHS